MTNTQINHSKETMGIGLEKDLSAIRMEIGDLLELFLVLQWLKGEISHKFVRTANREVINLTILFSADLTIDLRLVSHITIKNFHKTKTGYRPNWFVHYS